MTTSLKMVRRPSSNSEKNIEIQAEFSLLEGFVFLPTTGAEEQHAR